MFFVVCQLFEPFTGDLSQFCFAKCLHTCTLLNIPKAGSNHRLLLTWSTVSSTIMGKYLCNLNQRYHQSFLFSLVVQRIPSALLKCRKSHKVRLLIFPVCETHQTTHKMAAWRQNRLHEERAGRNCHQRNIALCIPERRHFLTGNKNEWHVKIARPCETQEFSHCTVRHKSLTNN